MNLTTNTQKSNMGILTTISGNPHPTALCGFFSPKLYGGSGELNKIPSGNKLRRLIAVSEARHHLKSGEKTKYDQETTMSIKPIKGQIRPNLSIEQNIDLLNSIEFINGKNYWQVTPTGDYAVDCNTGNNFANTALNYMYQANFTPLLGWITNSMIANGEFTGIEVGFMAKISSHSTQNFRVETLIQKMQEQSA